MTDQKTNVMRLLEQKKISYSAHGYPHGEEPVDGVTVAAILGKDPSQLYKTLVARGASKTIYVFDIPADCELNLKKAAKSVGEKSVAMVHVSELLQLTGYVRGGCSPIGMKKQYKTVFYSGIEALETVTVSAGRIGYQVELSPKDLILITRAETADIVEE